jgi:hypothetical protein
MFDLLCGENDPADYNGCTVYKVLQEDTAPFGATHKKKN